MIRIARQVPSLLSQTSLCGRACFSTSKPVDELRNLARVNIVDNSIYAQKVAATGRPARIIHIYTKSKIGRLGQRVLVAVAGDKVQAYIVGVRKKQTHMKPTFDGNNVVLVDEAGNPLGTRITAPLPHALRPLPNMSKILALGGRFV